MGNRLFNEVAALTGLPENAISNELVEILAKAGSCPESVTIETLREAMVAYLEQLALEMESETLQDKES